MNGLGLPLPLTGRLAALTPDHEQRKRVQYFCSSGWGVVAHRFGDCRDHSIGDWPVRSGSVVHVVAVNFDCRLSKIGRSQQVTGRVVTCNTKKKRGRSTLFRATSTTYRTANDSTTYSAFVLQSFVP